MRAVSFAGDAMRQLTTIAALVAAAHAGGGAVTSRGAGSSDACLL
jgi:acyl-CoA hydrolase